MRQLRSESNSAVSKHARPSTIAELDDAIAARYEAQDGEPWDRSQSFASAQRSLREYRAYIDRLVVAADDPFAAGAAQLLAACDVSINADSILQRAGQALLQGDEPMRAAVKIVSAQSQTAAPRTLDYDDVTAHVDNARTLLDVLFNEIEHGTDGGVRHRFLVLLDAVDDHLRAIEQSSDALEVVRS